MKVLLSHGYFIQEDPKEQEIMRPYPPLGILYIAAYLKQNTIDCAVFDSTFSSKQAWKSFLLEQRPEILALYANLMTKINLIELMRFVRSEESLKDTIIVLGGPDVTYNCENYLHAGADYLILGEGEQTMLELVETITVKGEVGEVNGIAFLKNGAVSRTPARTHLKKLDELPMPDRRAVDLQLYLDAWKTHHGSSTLSISTQRGCPYTCEWCSTAVYGQSYRRRGAEEVAKEVAWLIENYAPDRLWFVDDVFTVSHKWIAELHTAFKEQKIKIPFECITRAERLTETVLEQLSEMGCDKIWIGAESGSQRIIEAMDRRVDVKVVQEQIRAARRWGIGTGTFIMLGYPNETVQDIQETVNHLKAALPDQFTITVAYPIAGTALYERVKPGMKLPENWQTSTDRDIDFERVYPRKFYDHAVRYVVNAVHAHRYMTQERSLTKWGKARLKAFVARTYMRMYKPIDAA